MVAVGISLVAGTVLGAIAGYYGGIADYIISSITDVAWAFPTTLLAIAFIAALGTGSKRNNSHCAGQLVGILPGSKGTVFVSERT